MVLCAPPCLGRPLPGCSHPPLSSAFYLPIALTQLGPSTKQCLALAMVPKTCQWNM